MNRWQDYGAAADAPYPQPRPAGRRWPGWLLAAAVAGAGGGGAAMLLTGFEAPTAMGEPPLIRAAEGPTKIKPERPGGMEVPHQETLVFRQLDGSAPGPAVERLLPGPEQPLPRPVAVPEVPVLPETETTLPGLPAPPPVVPQMPANEFAYMAAVNRVPDQAPRPYAPGSAEPAQPQAFPPAPAPQPEPAAVVSPPPPAPAVSGGWGVQVASVRNEAAAEAEWKRLKSRYRDILGGLDLTVIRADLGERGIFYRVVGGSVAQEKAKAICADLKAQNVGCFVTGP